MTAGAPSHSPMATGSPSHSGMVSGAPSHSHVVADPPGWITLSTNSKMGENITISRWQKKVAIGSSLDQGVSELFIIQGQIDKIGHFDGSSVEPLYTKNHRFFCRSVTRNSARACTLDLSHFLISTFPISISNFRFPRSLFYNYPGGLGMRLMPVCTCARVMYMGVVLKLLRQHNFLAWPSSRSKQAWKFSVVSLSLPSVSLNLLPWCLRLCALIQMASQSGRTYNYSCSTGNVSAMLSLLNTSSFSGPVSDRHFRCLDLFPIQNENPTMPNIFSVFLNSFM